MYDFLDNNLLSRLGSRPIEARVPMLGNVAGIRQNFVCPASAPRPLPRQPGQRQH